MNTCFINKFCILLLFHDVSQSQHGNGFEEFIIGTNQRHDHLEGDKVSHGLCLLCYIEKTSSK